MLRYAQAKTCVVVVFGVTGSGKTRIGAALARSLHWTFYDADDFHGQKNLAKLQRGIPLTDRDRGPWLNRLRRTIKRCLAERHSMILACSALKRMYRQHLRISDRVIFVYLKVTPTVVERRLRQRKGHFMNADLIESQFATLEEPTDDAFVANATQKPRDIVNGLRKQLLAQGCCPGPQHISCRSWP
jgi:gluconokinase